MKVLILGASRGIGLEFARQYAAAGDAVIATARDAQGLERLRTLGVQALQLDVTEPASISGLGWQLDGEKIDLAVYVAGVMSHGGATEPPARAEFDRVMHTNVLGAMQALPQVGPWVEAAGGTFAFVSSQMGHIAGTSGSHSWVYRASKAALNMAVRAARADYPRARLLAISPGWVRTDMGGADAPLTAEQSVAAMRQALAQPGGSGVFLDHQGRPFEGW